MKTIIEVNTKIKMPDTCIDCPFCELIEEREHGELTGYGEYVCLLENMPVGDTIDDGEDGKNIRMTWCPVMSITEVEDET